MVRRIISNLPATAIGQISDRRFRDEGLLPELRRLSRMLVQ